MPGTRDTKYVRPVDPGTMARAAGEASRRHRRLAGAGWLYDLGLVLFSGSEQLGAVGPGPRLLGSYASLGLRDCALLIRALRGEASTAPALATIPLSIAAVARLRKVIPRERLLRDRPLSQMGVAPGYAL